MTKDHIFSYVYGTLHSPDYRERYEADLAKTTAAHPRSHEQQRHSDLFSKAGQQLLELHIGYEAAEPYPLEERLAVGRSRWAGTLPSAEDALGNGPDKNPGPLSDRLQ